MKKIMTLVMVLSVLGGVLVGCSGGDKAADANAPATTAGAASSEPGK